MLEILGSVRGTRLTFSKGELGQQIVMLSKGNIIICVIGLRGGLAGSQRNTNHREAALGGVEAVIEECMSLIRIHRIPNQRCRSICDRRSRADPWLLAVSRIDNDLGGIARIIRKCRSIHDITTLR